MRNHKIASVTREDIGDVIVISMVIQYIGKKKLLEVSKTAFLAASTIHPELNKLLDENRLLIISVSNAPRQSKATALVRNKYICEIADKVFFVGVNEKSSLYPLYHQFASKNLDNIVG